MSEEQSDKNILHRWAIIENGIPREVTFSEFELDGVNYKGPSLYLRGEEAVLSLGIKKIIDEQPLAEIFTRLNVNDPESWIIDGDTVRITYSLQDYDVSEAVIDLKSLSHRKKEELLQQGYFSSIINDIIQIREQDMQNLTYLWSYAKAYPNQSVNIRAESNVIYSVTSEQASEILSGAFDKIQQITQQTWQKIDQITAINTIEEARAILPTI